MIVRESDPPFVPTHESVNDCVDPTYCEREPSTFTDPIPEMLHVDAFVVDQESVVFPGVERYEGDAVKELIWKLLTTWLTCTVTVRESLPPFTPLHIRVNDCVDPTYCERVPFTFTEPIPEIVQDDAFSEDHERFVVPPPFEKYEGDALKLITRTSFPVPPPQERVENCLHG